MDNEATAPQAVNWEAVRALAMVVGVREAARRMGVSEAAAMQQSNRKGWLASPEAKAANKMAIAMRSGTSAPACQQVSAGALILGEIAQLGSKTRLSLARGVAKATEHVETMSGSDILNKSGDVKAIAQTADLVHGWKDAAPQVKIRLDVLGSVQEQPVYDVQTDITPSDSWDSEPDPLDEY